MKKFKCDLEGCTGTLKVKNQGNVDRGEWKKDSKGRWQKDKKPSKYGITLQCNNNACKNVVIETGRSKAEVLHKLSLKLCKKEEQP